LGNLHHNGEVPSGLLIRLGEWWEVGRLQDRLSMNLVHFLNPWMLGALLLLAVPFLIHWYFQRRKPRILFPTLAFFEGTPPRPFRSRMQHVGLAALRAAVVLMLVLAFSQPYLSDRSVPGRTPAFGLVMDVSLSVQAEVGEGRRWDILKAKAVDLLRQMPGDSQVILVEAGARPKVLQERGSRDRALALVEAMNPTEEDTDLEIAAQQALSALRELGPTYEKELVIFSDFQKSSARHLGIRPLPEGLKVTLVPVGESFVPNAAVSDIRLVRGIRDEVEAVVSNHSDRPLQRVDLELWLDGEPAQTREINVSAFGAGQFRFPLSALPPGTHMVKVVLTVDDALKVDNQRDLAFQVSPPLHTLILESVGDRSGRQQAFFLANALAPTTGSVAYAGPGFTVETVPAPLAPARLNRSDKRAPVRLVVVPPLTKPTPDLAAALFTHAAQGGGVIFFVGPNLPYREFNEVFKDVLPALLEGPQSAASAALRRWKLGEVDRKGIFQPFRDSRSGDLTLPEFTDRFGMLPVEGGKVAAAFDDGAPALVTLQVGEGRVALVNTTMEAGWTDWPKRRSYLPFVHGLARYLTGEDAETMMSRRDVVSVSDRSDVRLGLAWANRPLDLFYQAEARGEVTVDRDGWLRGLPLDRAGFYFLRDGQGREIRVVAAVSPEGEQDLSSFSTSEIESRFQFQREVDVGETFATVRPEFWGWQWLLALAGLLVVVELWWANRVAE
jgi:hypothetical protein